MQITQSIDLNLSIDGIPPQLHMPQGDGGRIISASLWDGAQIYSPPDGTMCMLRFRKPDGTGGLYDTAEDKAKINLANNVATIPVALQVLAVGGPVHCQVELYAPAAEGELLSANRLATFEFEILVSPSVYPDAEVISGDYVNIISKQLELLASKAEANADAAAGSATNAATSATSAGKSASAASEKASDAANSASAAATSAQTAQSAARAATDAAGTASAAAEAASGSASRAQESATAAAESAASVDGINKTAQSWAVGGTGTREGEDTNNAKYWAEQAQQAVGGVVSFNGRAGSVVPQAGDYDKEMVGLGNVDNTSDLEKPISTATQTALNAKPSMVIAEIPKGRMRGDVDGDGKITENDALSIRKHTDGSIPLTGADLWCADVNVDNKINSTDVLQLNNYFRGKPSALTKTPTFADYYNNWTYHKVDDTSGYWTTELSIPAITTETEGSIIWGGTGFAGTFIKAETFSGGVRIYANYPPIEALPCVVSYHTGAGGQFIIANTGVSETGAKYVVADLTASGWSEEKKQIISVPGLKEDALKQLIIPTQLSTDIEKYYSAGIRISARGDNTLTFSCDTIPTAKITVVLVIIPIVGKFEA